jgi:hypothetical protein
LPCGWRSLCVGSWHFTKGGVHVQWVLLCLMGSLGWFVAMWVFVSFCEFLTSKQRSCMAPYIWLVASTQEE